MSITVKERARRKTSERAGEMPPAADDLSSIPAGGQGGGGVGGDVSAGYDGGGGGVPPESSSDTESYKLTIDVRFEGMPEIQLESYAIGRHANNAQRLANATRRRRFTLSKDWTIELDQVDYSDDLNGTVQIPARTEDHRPIVFDGASIPVPWLVSLLTIGILRPLGVILVGSIVHDYAYRFGELRVSRNGKDYDTVQLSRHRADKLFRDIVGTVNQLRPVGYVAWFFVRLGWFFVKYNGKRRGGRAPWAEYMLFAMILGGLWSLASAIGTGALFSWMLCGYVLLYSASLWVNHLQNGVDGESVG